MIYDREKNFTQVIADVQKKTDELKSLQYIGNDNLVVQSDVVIQPGPINVTTSGKKWRALYVFDEPTNAYTRLTFFWDAIGSFLYNEYRYYDHTTMESLMQIAAFIEIVPTSTATLLYMTAAVSSTMPGTLTLTEV